MKKKLTILIVSLSVIVLGIIGVILFEVNQLVNINQRIGSLMQISEMANSLHSESFRYELGLMEYANNPTQTTLATINEIDQNVNLILNKFSTAIHSEEAQIYPGGLVYADEALMKVEQLIPFADDINAITNQPSSVSQQLQLRQSALDKKKAFDDLELEQRTKEFSSKQVMFGAQIGEKLTQTTNFIQLLCVILAGLYLGLLAVIAVWLGSLVSTIDRKVNKYE